LQRSFTFSLLTNNKVRLANFDEFYNFRGPQ